MTETTSVLKLSPYHRDLLLDALDDLVRLQKGEAGPDDPRLHDSRYPELRDEVSRQLEGGVVLSAEAVKKMRILLMAELRASGGRAPLEGSEEPGLDEATRQSEANLQAVLRLVGGAAYVIDEDTGEFWPSKDSRRS